MFNELGNITRKCHRWALDTQITAQQNFEHILGRGQAYCPDVLIRGTQALRHNYAQVVQHLPDDPIASAALTAAAVGVVYKCIDYAGPAFLTAPPSLQGVGIAAVFLLRLIHSYSPSLASACLVGAVTGGIIAVAFVSTSLPVVLGSSVFGALTGARLAWESDEDKHEDEASQTSSAGEQDISGAGADTQPPSAPTDSPIRPLCSSPSLGEFSMARAESANALNTGDVTDPEAELRTAFQKTYEETQQLLATKIQLLTGDNAIPYRHKAADLLDVVPPAAPDGEAQASLTHLKKFVPLVDSMVPLNYSVEERVQYCDTLCTRLKADIVGNKRIIRKIRDVTLSHMNHATQASVVCLTGQTGSGKNEIANTVGSVAGAFKCIHLSSLDLKTFAGSAAVWTKSEESGITKLLRNAPGQFVVLQIDEIDQADFAHQEALLSLLAPANTFTDQHFGLPINKSRLFIICTMKGENVQRDLLPDLWSRLRNHSVETERLTPATRRLIAVRSLAKQLSLKRIQLTEQQVTSMAMELSHSVSEKEGRFLTEEAKRLVDSITSLQDRGLLPSLLDAAFAARVIRETWTTVNAVGRYGEEEENYDVIKQAAFGKQYLPAHIEANVDFSVRAPFLIFHAVLVEESPARLSWTTIIGTTWTVTTTLEDNRLRSFAQKLNSDPIEITDSLEYLNEVEEASSKRCVDIMSRDPLMMRTPQLEPPEWFSQYLLDEYGAGPAALYRETEDGDVLWKASFRVCPDKVTELKQSSFLRDFFFEYPPGAAHPRLARLSARFELQHGAFTMPLKRNLPPSVSAGTSRATSYLSCETDTGLLELTEW